MKARTKILSRRMFLRGSAVVVAGPYLLAGELPAPSNTLTMGLVGLGSMGMRHIKGFLQEPDCRILAVCDVDAQRLHTALEEVNKHYGNRDCSAYKDFHELIARNEIDTL